MARPTIPDLARAAGLSTATVDRVLNGRDGVSAANRHRVLAAARDLGYLPREGLLALPARPAHLEFFLPSLAPGFMRSLAASIRGFAASLPLVASCRVAEVGGLAPEALARAVEGIGPRTSGVGVVATDAPGTRALVARLAEAGVRVVTIASDLPGSRRAAYVGVDNRAAGRTAGALVGLLAGPAPGAVGLFPGSRAYHGHREREAGFRAVLHERFPHLAVLPGEETGEDGGRSRAALGRLLRDRDDVAAVYALGAGRSGIAEALREVAPERRPRAVLHDLTPSTRAWLAEGLIDVIIDQNARLLGEQAVLRLLGSIATAAPFLSLRDIEPRILLRENVPAPDPGSDVGS